MKKEVGEKMLTRQFWSIFIGLIVPFVAVLGGIPFIGKSDASVMGFPIIYFWIFLWFPLTTLCLCISWQFFDRYAYDNTQEEGGN
jgi:hypothetical protein